LICVEKFCETPKFREFCLLEYNAISALKVNQCFGGKCCLHLQGQRISQTRNQHEAVSKKSRLHTVISQKVELFITTAVRTSNSTTPVQIS
jgi:hypothetical protein